MNMNNVVITERSTIDAAVKRFSIVELRILKDFKGFLGPRGLF